MGKLLVECAPTATEHEHHGFFAIYATLWAARRSYGLYETHDHN